MRGEKSETRIPVLYEEETAAMASTHLHSPQLSIGIDCRYMNHSYRSAVCVRDEFP